jgi:hypothetical protein
VPPDVRRRVIVIVGRPLGTAAALQEEGGSQQGDG